MIAAARAAAACPSSDDPAVMALLRRVRPPLPGAQCRHRLLSTYGHVYDPHITLGVRPGCTQQELKAAYRKLALRHHPDRLTATDDAAVAARQFAQVSEAFETLQAQRKGLASRAGAAARTHWGEQGHGSAWQHQQAQSAPGSVHPSSLTAPGVAFAGLALGIMFLVSRVSASPPAPAARPKRSILEKHEVAPIGWSRRRRAEQKQQEPLTTPAAAAVAATASASAAAAGGEEPTSTAAAAAAPPRPLASEAATAELPVPAAAGAAAGAGAATAAATAGVDAGNTAKTAKNKRKMKRAYGNSYLPHTGPGRVRHKQSATSATVACHVQTAFTLVGLSCLCLQGAKSPYGGKGTTGGSSYKLKARPPDWIDPPRRNRCGETSYVLLQAPECF